MNSSPPWERGYWLNLLWDIHLGFEILCGPPLPPPLPWPLSLLILNSVAAFMSSTYTPLLRFDEPRFGRPMALSGLISSTDWNHPLFGVEPYSFLFYRVTHSDLGLHVQWRLNHWVPSAPTPLSTTRNTPISVNTSDNKEQQVAFPYRVSSYCYYFFLEYSPLTASGGSKWEGMLLVHWKGI